MHFQAVARTNIKHRIVNSAPSKVQCDCVINIKRPLACQMYIRLFSSYFEWFIGGALTQRLSLIDDE